MVFLIELILDLFFSTHHTKNVAYEVVVPENPWLRAQGV